MKHLMAFGMVTAFGFVLAACGGGGSEAKTPDAVEQDAEKAGEKAGEEIEKAGDKAEEAGDEAKKEMQKD
ncbi:hypothetical protein [Polyangium sp. 15x6]|uniref:hypothetical protein n=1 Tax=Polyangium sp. 15x6 TaxID=3042687 RepID=UPI00249A5FBE|nr:hypothetical protein [Polyangium sp. 15x6]MDI3283476.1 hypothetical protein [Polyangium sp. 15x6]